MVSESEKVRVAITGAGIGGLALALCLKDTTKVEVSVYESANKIAEIGAGVALWPRTWHIWKQLGLEDQFDKILDRPFDIDKPELVFRFIKGDQKVGKVLGDLLLPGGMHNFHRADVQELLLQNIPSSVKFHLSKRLLSYSKDLDGSMTLKFEDGSDAICDLLVGADGVKSAVRGCVAKEKDGVCINPVWSGVTVYRAVFPTELLRRKMPEHNVITKGHVMYWGKNKHIVVYPISQGRLINVVAFSSQPSLEGTECPTPWVADATRDEYMKVFSSWDDEVRTLLGINDKMSRWYLHAVKPLSTYVSDNVVLIGDAAHGMMPHLGAGAGQAIDDAFVLAGLMGCSNFGRSTVKDALKTFDEIRQPTGNHVLNTTREQGFKFEFNTEELADVEEGDENIEDEKLKRLYESSSEGFRWPHKRETVLEERQRAISTMIA